MWDDCMARLEYKFRREHKEELAIAFSSLVITGLLAVQMPKGQKTHLRAFLLHAHKMCDYSEVIVYQKPTVVVGFQPVVQVNLIKIRCDEFFAKLMCLGTEKGNLQPG